MGLGSPLEETLGRKLGLDISRVYIDYDSNIMGHHRNAILPNEGGNKFSKPDIDMNLHLILPSLSALIIYSMTHCI